MLLCLQTLSLQWDQTERPGVNSKEGLVFQVRNREKAWKASSTDPQKCTVASLAPNIKASLCLGKERKPSAHFQVSSAACREFCLSANSCTMTYRVLQPGHRICDLHSLWENLPQVPKPINSHI